MKIYSFHKISFSLGFKAGYSLVTKFPGKEIHITRHIQARLKNQHYSDQMGCTNKDRFLNLALAEADSEKNLNRTIIFRCVQ